MIDKIKILLILKAEIVIIYYYDMQQVLSKKIAKLSFNFNYNYSWKLRLALLSNSPTTLPPTHPPTQPPNQKSSENNLDIT